MSVISIRLNEEEKSILNELSKVYDTSISSMIKKLAFEKLEDNFDLELVTRYEKQKLNQIFELSDIEELSHQVGIDWNEL